MGGGRLIGALLLRSTFKWMKYTSSKFNYSAPKKTTQHSVKSTQYTLKHCTKIFECFKAGRMIWFCMRSSQICLIKWCVKWRFSPNLVICIFLWNKRIFCQKNYPVVFVMPLSIYRKKYERNQIFDPCRVIFHIYGQGLLRLKIIHLAVGDYRQLMHARKCQIID